MGYNVKLISLNTYEVFIRVYTSINMNS